MDNKELQGRTLQVYLYVVKENRPVGPRDVLRSLGLSSPSVAYRHLQKLETMNLIIKNPNGSYINKEKVSISGYTWVGRKLIPRPFIYSLGFLGILIIELAVLAIHFSVETNQFKIFFIMLVSLTVTALILFLIEGLRIIRKTRIDNSDTT